MTKLPSEYKTALITGGCGFIGSHICEELVKQGIRVICMDNLVAGKMENTKVWWDSSLCTFAPADVSDLNAMIHWFAGVDVVFHNAASKCTVCYDDPKRDLMTNAWGTLNVCIAAHEAGVKKVIHASTGSASDVKSYYGASKLMGESYVKSFKEYHPDFNYTILRYYHVYGPRQDASSKGGVIPIFIRQCYTGKPITVFGDGEQVRHFTYVKDVVCANFNAVTSEAYDGMTVIVANDLEKTTINQLANDVRKCMDRDVPVEHLQVKKGDIKSFTFPGPWDNQGGSTKYPEGLQKTINWYVNKWDRSA